MSSGGPSVPASAGGSNPVDANAVEQIYQKLAGMFGLGLTEVFQMEFPARILERGNYDYVGSDTINAQQAKPETVVDAEFRLSDDMYSISNIMGGANGAKVSEQYSEVLFGLVPMAQDEDSAGKSLLDDQNNICSWLTELVDDFTPPVDDVLKSLPTEYSSYIPGKNGSDGSSDSSSMIVDSDGIVRPSRKDYDADSDGTLNPTTNTAPKGIARVDLYQKLLNLYEDERFRWATFKRNARPKDMTTAGAADIDNFNRMLATYAPIVDKKLESLWTVLLVRGQYHRVRRFIGYIDVESASEILQRAKENLRASVARSIDDTQDIYPVYMEPANWASYLTTAFTPEDLLSSESIVREQIFEKEKTRSVLLLKRNAILGAGKDVAAAEAAERAASDKFKGAQTALNTGFTDSALKVIELYFDAYKASNGDLKAVTSIIGALKDTDLATLNTELKEQNQATIDTPAAFDNLKTQQINLMKTQLDYQSAGEELAKAQAAAATARASDTSTALGEIDQTIQSLTMDINYLMESMKVSQNATSQPLNIKDADGTDKQIPVAPANGTPDSKINVPTQSVGASIWTEIVTETSKSSSAASNFNSACASNTSWNVGIFFASASGSDRTATATHSDVYNSQNCSIQVGFRAMKVSINRPWLDAGLFRLTHEFCHMEDTPISSADPELVRTSLGYPGRDGKVLPDTPKPQDTTIDDMNKCMFPSWANGFIVVKDVHIIIEAQTAFDANTVADIQKTTSNGGGFLCFSAGKSDSYSEHRTSAAVAVAGSSMSIKIPAPQIIGWICELCPKDNCKKLTDYKKLDESEFREARLGS